MPAAKRSLSPTTPLSDTMFAPTPRSDERKKVSFHDRSKTSPVAPSIARRFPCFETQRCRKPSSAFQCRTARFSNTTLDRSAFPVGGVSADKAGLGEAKRDAGFAPSSSSSSACSTGGRMSAPRVAGTHEPEIRKQLRHKAFQLNNDQTFKQSDRQRGECDLPLNELRFRGVRPEAKAGSDRGRVIRTGS